MNKNLSKNTNHLQPLYPPIHSKSLMSHWRCLQHRSMAALTGSMLRWFQRLEPMQADHHFSSFWTEHDPTEKWTWRYPFSSSMIMGERIYQFVSKRDFSNGNHIQTHDDRFKQSQQLKASPRQQFSLCYYSHYHSKYLVPHPTSLIINNIIIIIIFVFCFMLTAIHYDPSSPQSPWTLPNPP